MISTGISLPHTVCPDCIITMPKQRYSAILAIAKAALKQTGRANVTKTGVAVKTTARQATKKAPMTRMRTRVGSKVRIRSTLIKPTAAQLTTETTNNQVNMMRGRMISASLKHGQQGQHMSAHITSQSRCCEPCGFQQLKTRNTNTSSLNFRFPKKSKKALQASTSPVAFYVAVQPLLAAREQEKPN